MTVTDAPYEAHLSKEDHKVKYPHIASEADMKAHRLKLPTRDLCSGYLIPLNQCRFETFMLPWKCEPELHNYEICQYKDFLRRMRKAARLREEARVNKTGPVVRIDEKLNDAYQLMDRMAAQEPYEMKGPPGSGY